MKVCAVTELIMPTTKPVQDKQTTLSLSSLTYGIGLQTSWKKAGVPSREPGFMAVLATWASIAISGETRGKAVGYGNALDAKLNLIDKSWPLRPGGGSMAESQSMSAPILLTRARGLGVRKRLRLSVSITSKRLWRSLSVVQDCLRWSVWLKRALSKCQMQW